MRGFMVMIVCIGLLSPFSVMVANEDFCSGSATKNVITTGGDYYWEGGQPNVYHIYIYHKRI